MTLYTANTTNAQRASIATLESELEAPEEALAVFTVTMNARFERLDDQLSRNSHVAGNAFTVADVLAYPMSALAARDFPAVGALPNLRRWLGKLAELPSIAQAMPGSPTATPASTRCQMPGPSVSRDDGFSRRKGVPLPRSAAKAGVHTYDRKLLSVGSGPRAP